MHALSSVLLLVADFNFKGDASVLGGMMVIKPASGKMGAQLEYIFLEKVMASSPPRALKSAAV